MKKSTLSPYRLVAALVVLGLGTSHLIQAENNNNQEAPDSHTTRSSLSWSGPYIGTIFSASGRLIDALLYLNSDDTFVLSYSYEDIPERVFFISGKFEWDKTESNITLDAEDFPPYYKVVSRRLIQLDNSGKIITGDQAENYEFTKVELGPSPCNF